MESKGHKLAFAKLYFTFGLWIQTPEAQIPRLAWWVSPWSRMQTWHYHVSSYMSSVFRIKVSTKFCRESMKTRSLHQKLGLQNFHRQTTVCLFSEYIPTKFSWHLYCVGTWCRAGRGSFCGPRGRRRGRGRGSRGISRSRWRRPPSGRARCCPSPAVTQVVQHSH